jgi:DHA2 family multidrug resistance protein
LFGLGIVVAPVVGPTLGGWLTDELSWRWTFYINLPVGILAIFLMLLVVEDPPYIRANRPGRIDAMGFGLMGLFLGTLQIMLDKGQDADWFSAVWMRWFAVICATCFIGFIVRELKTDNPIVNLRIFKNRNFAISSALFGIFGLALYALIALQPLFLQTLLGYTAYAAGLSVTPRGIGALLGLFCVGALASRVNPKILVAFGFAALGLSSFLLSRLDLQMSMSNIFWPNIISGMGTSFIFVPLTTLAIGTLRNEQIGNATGLQNLVRNIGGSVGLAFVSTMLERYAQTHQAMMVAQLSPLNPQYQQHLDSAQRLMELQIDPAGALARAHGLLYHTLLQQSNCWSFMNLFFIVACLCALCVLCVPVFQKPRHVGAVTLAE